MEKVNHQILKPETLEHTRKKIEAGMTDQMPISFSTLLTMSEENEATKKTFLEMLRYSNLYIADVWEMKELIKRKSEFEYDEWAALFAKADDDRTRLHNNFIDSVAAFLRAANAAELDTEWARSLMPTGKLERARCGSFAIMLVYSQYVNSQRNVAHG